MRDETRTVKPQSDCRRKNVTAASFGSQESNMHLSIAPCREVEVQMHSGSTVSVGQDVAFTAVLRHGVEHAVIRKQYQHVFRDMESQ
jgi:hypothetical protein